MCAQGPHIHSKLLSLVALQALRHTNTSAHERKTCPNTSADWCLETWKIICKTHCLVPIASRFFSIRGCMASSGCLWLQNPVTRMGSSGLGSPMEMFQHAPVVCRSIAAIFSCIFQSSIFSSLLLPVNPIVLSGTMFILRPLISFHFNRKLNPELRDFWRGRNSRLPGWSASTASRVSLELLLGSNCLPNLGVSRLLENSPVLIRFPFISCPFENR